MTTKENRRPRRYLRSRITRKLILDTALEVFLAEGYAKTTITKISEKANVGYGTVYSHFKGKDDILKKVVDGVLDEFYHLLEVPFKPTDYAGAREIFLKVIETSFRLAEQHRTIMRVFQEALGQSEEIFNHWKAVKEHFISTSSRSITYGQQLGLAKDIDPAKAAKAYILLIDRFLWEVVQEEEKDIEYLAAFLTDMIFEGFFIKTA